MATVETGNISLFTLDIITSCGNIAITINISGRGTQRLKDMTDLQDKMRKGYEETERLGGIQRKYTFDNGYSASVIKSQYSYGGENGKWELAVLKGDSLCYDTPITSDVEGHLSVKDVNALLEKINALPAIK